MTLDRLGQRYGCDPIAFLDSNLMDWSLRLLIAQAGNEQDREDREAMQAEAEGKLRVREVNEETKLSRALKRRKK